MVSPPQPPTFLCPVFFFFFYILPHNYPFFLSPFLLCSHSTHLFLPSVADVVDVPPLGADSVLSDTPIFPPLPFCTFAATLHLLFSSSRDFFLPLAYVSIAADLPPSTSPWIHLSLTSHLAHLLCPSLASLPLLPFRRCALTAKDVTAHPCSPLGETSPICMTGAGAFLRGSDGWMERGVVEESAALNYSYLVHRMNKCIRTPVLCYLSRVWYLCMLKVIIWRCPAYARVPCRRMALDFIFAQGYEF